MKIYTKEWYRSGCTKHNQITDKNYIDNDLINLHDCQIISNDFPDARSQGKHILLLDNSGSMSNINKIVIDNYTVLENCKLKNAWCIAEELYKLDNGRYELHLLTQYITKHNEELNYLTVKCKHIEFVGNGFHIEYK
ncbi:MAG: DUF4085 family protein [Eubacteriales bacterium]|nr:DUF4085 family protein [Eubacteriales bacterium]